MNASVVVSELTESRTRLIDGNVAHVSNIHKAQTVFLKESESWCSQSNSEHSQFHTDCDAVIGEIETSMQVTNIASKDVKSMLEIRTDEDSDVRL